MVPPARDLWAPGTIVGDGAKPGTYDIHAHEAGLLKDVSPLAVRWATTVSPGDLVDLGGPPMPIRNPEIDAGRNARPKPRFVTKM